jgi:O-antigen/teichoic acid export membrane protein
MHVMAAPLKKRLVSAGSWVLGGKFLVAASNLIVGSLLARLLSTEEFGEYGVAFTVVTIGGMFALLGLHQSVVRFVASSLSLGRPARARASVLLAFRWGLIGTAGLAAFLLLGGGAWLARDFWDAPAIAAALPAVAVWLGVTAMQLLTSETFRGFHDLRLATTFGGVISGWLLASVLGLVLVLGRTITLGQALWLGAAAGAVSVALALVALWRKLAELPAGEAIGRREVFAVSAPLWVSGVAASLLGQSSLWIIAGYLPPEDVALFYAAMRLVTVVSMPLILVNLLVPPFIAELHAVGQHARLQRVLRTTATLAGIPGFVVLLGFVLFGGSILALLYGEVYRAAGPVLAILSVGYLVNVWTGSCGMTLAMTGNQSTLMVITLVTSALSVVGTLLVIRTGYGIVAVALTVCVMTCLYNVLGWLAARYLTGLWTHATVPRLADVRELLKR